MSNTTNLYFLLIINSGLGGDWTYFLLLVYFYSDGSWLFTLCVIFCLNFMVHIQYPFYYFLANKKYPIFSILRKTNDDLRFTSHVLGDSNNSFKTDILLYFIAFVIAQKCTCLANKLLSACEILIFQLVILKNQIFSW